MAIPRQRGSGANSVEPLVLQASVALLLPLVLCAGCHTRPPTDFGLLRLPARIELAHKDGFRLRALDPQGATPLACRVHRIEAGLTRTAPDTFSLSNILVHGRAARREPSSAGLAFVVLAAQSPPAAPLVHLHQPLHLDRNHLHAPRRGLIKRKPALDLARKRLEPRGVFVSEMRRR